MKYGVLAIFITMMLFATTIWAEDLEWPRLNSNDMAADLLEGTSSQSEFTPISFKSFNTDLGYLKFLKLFSNFEYGIEKKACFPGQEKHLQRQALVTRLQLFNKPIYLTFSISE